MHSEPADRVKDIIRSIPPGRVSSYGAIAAAAGYPRAARLVARVLHACSDADALPWHRVLRKDGSIALDRGYGFEEQKALLEAAGVAVSAEGRVDIARLDAFPAGGRR